jgi:hypothetical protein
LLPDFGRRLQKDLDLAEYTDAISAMNGGTALSFASTFRQS